MLLDNTKRTIAGADLSLKSLIKVGCIHTTAALRVPGILQAFGEDYPEVEFKIKTGTTSALVKEVLACQLDGAFVAGNLVDERLIVQPVLTEELGIVVSSLVTSYEQLKNSKKKIKLIVFSDGCSYRKHFERIISGWAINQISLIEMDTLEGILNAVENNIGISLLPVALIERHYKYKAVKVFPLLAELSLMTTVFVKRNDSAMSEGYQKFFEMLARGYKTSV